MKKKTKRVVMSSACLLVAGFAILNLLAYNHAYAMMHFTAQGARTSEPERLTGWAKLKVLLSGVSIPRPTSALPPSTVDPECLALPIHGPGDMELACWYRDRGTNTPLVILFHGYAAEKSSLVAEAKSFLALGTSVLLVDFRGSGGSSESYTTLGVREAHDVSLVVRYAEERLRHTRIILFGQSMGAVAILRAVEQDGILPDAVIVEAVFDTMLNTVRNRFKAMRVPSFPCAQLLVFWGGRQWRFDGFSHNPVSYAKALPCPALFMHGSDDPRAALTEGRRVFDAAPGNNTFKTFAGTRHESYVSTHPVEWTTAVGTFMKATENQAPANGIGIGIGIEPR